MPDGQPNVLERIFATGLSEEASVVGALFETKNKGRLKMTTEISPDLIFLMSCLEVISNRFKSDVLKSFAREFYQLEVSKDRKGRLELVEALLSVRKPEEE